MGYSGVPAAQKAIAKRRIILSGTAAKPTGFAPYLSAPTRLRGTFKKERFCVFIIIGIRTPELIFSAEKISEAVPRARASDGERETRGRVLVGAPAKTPLPKVMIGIMTFGRGVFAISLADLP